MLNQDNVLTISTLLDWVFSLPVCLIMYGYNREKLHVNHFWVNPLHPDISLQILHTVLYTIPKDEENLFNNK